MKKSSLRPLSFAAFVLSLILLSISQAFAEEKPLIVSCRVNPNALLSSDFIKRLSALSEWEPFFQTFTQACDKALAKELSKEKFQSLLPVPIADDLDKALDKGVDTRRWLEEFYQHTESILFELRGGGQLSGLLVFLTDRDPRKTLVALKYARENTDYEFLKNEENGDFILKFHFTLHGRDIAFHAAGLKLSDDRFALLLSNDDGILSHCNADGKARFAALDTSTPFKELSLEEACFVFLENQRKRLDVDDSVAEFLGKIKKLSLVFHDVDGVSQAEVSVTMKTPEDARALENLLAGLVALIQLQLKPDSEMADWLRAFQFQVDGENVSLSAKLDNGELWKLIARGLDRATREIKNR